MSANGPQNRAGCNPPPKPWERVGSSSGPVPFKPPSSGKTSDVVEASGTANPGENFSTSGRNVGVNTNALGRPLPSRPWENNYARNSYGAYGSGLNNSSYDARMYNSSYGQLGVYGSGPSGGGMYGGEMYRSNMYRGGGYGQGGVYGSGGYGGGVYNSGLGHGPQNPNNPYGEPPSPPGFWISFLRVMQGAVNFLGRMSILMDQNTQAIHLFMSALLQLFDRGGLLYGELARFALRVLGIKTKPRKLQGPDGLPGPQMQAVNGPKTAPASTPAPAGGWDNVWGNSMNR